MNRTPISQRYVGRLLAVGLVMSCVAVGMATTGAAAASPPKAPTLFVLRGAAQGADGRLTVRSRSVEWFTDRPDRRAGSMTPRALVRGWEGWGFANDPPNAALTGKDLDVVVELSAPRVRGGRLEFDAKRVRGELPHGNLGRVSAFVDGTDPYAQVPLQPSVNVQIINNSMMTTTVYLFATAPGTSAQTVVMAAYPLNPGVVDTATIGGTTTQVMCAPGVVETGATFQQQQTLSVPMGTSGQSTTAQLSEQGGNCTLASGSSGAPQPGSISVQSDDTVSPDGMMVALGIDGSPVLASQAQPNLVSSFSASGLVYWLAYGDDVQVGQVLDLPSIEDTLNVVNLAVPTAATMVTATLDTDGAWSVNPN